MTGAQPTDHLARQRLNGPSEWLRQQSRANANKRAITDDGLGRSFSFSELDTRVNKLINRLLEVGLSPGDRLGVLAIDSHQYFETTLACIRAGFTFVPLNIRLAESEIERLVERGQVKIMFVSEGFVALAERLQNSVTTVERTVLFGTEALNPEASDSGALGPEIYEDFIAESSDADPYLEVDPETIVALAFTSGTTGTPKAVMQPLRMMANLGTAGVIEYDIQPNDFRYAAAPLFHVAGLAFLLTGLAQGVGSLIVPQFTPEGVLAHLQSGEVTGAFLVPTMISMLLEQPNVRDVDYSWLNNIIYGAAPITPSVLREAIEVFGCGFVQLFGAGTEAGLQTVMSPADHVKALNGNEHILSSVGRPAYGVELTILDDNLDEVPTGTIGEVATRSSQVMVGYMDDSEATNEALRGGWFRAGDLGRLDEAGYVYLAGRSKDMIIRGGENLYPIDVESVIITHPDVVEVAVVGKPDAKWGETVHAFVVRREDQVTASKLDELCQANLAKSKVPVRFHWIDELPKNAGGKVVKQDLRGLLI